MTDITGIRQSVSRAWRLLNETGFLDMSRGLNAESYQLNVREAVRELREAARSLVHPDNLGAYGELSASLRLTLWKSILRARAPASSSSPIWVDGIRICRSMSVKRIAHCPDSPTGFRSGSFTG